MRPSLQKDVRGTGTLTYRSAKHNARRTAGIARGVPLPIGLTRWTFRMWGAAWYLKMTSRQLRHLPPRGEKRSVMELGACHHLGIRSSCQRRPDPFSLSEVRRIMLRKCVSQVLVENLSSSSGWSSHFRARNKSLFLAGTRSGMPTLTCMTIGGPA